MSNETGSSDFRSVNPEDVIVELIEGGLVKLPPRIEQLFKPYRQVTITCKRFRVENGKFLADLSFVTADMEIPAKVLLLPIQVIDGQGGEFTHYPSACNLIRDLNGMGGGT